MANRWMWFVFAVLSMALMAGLYTRVVYHLWFKRNDDNQLSYQQRVSDALCTFIQSTSIYIFRFINQNCLDVCDACEFYYAND